MDRVTSIIEAMSLKAKLMVMVFIPLVLMTIFVSILAFDAWKDKRRYAQMQQLTEVVIASNILVHELQKERGMTAGFIGSSGLKFGEALIQQRKLTDSKLRVLEQSTNSASFDDSSKHVLSKLKKVNTELARRQQVRDLVDQQALPLSEALTYYTNINGIFLSLGSDLSKISNDADLANMIAAYANFLQSKERAGIERAVLSNVFSKGEFGPLYVKFINLVNTQENYINVFLSLATDDIADYYYKAFEADVIAEVESMRDIALSKAASGSFDIEPTYWFEKQTQKINILKDVETYIEQTLTETVKSEAESSALSFYLEVITAFIGIFLTLYISLIIKKQIREQVGGEPEEIQQIANKIAEGNINQDFGSLDKSSGILKSVLYLQDQIQKTINQEINPIVQNAKAGVLSDRINIGKKQGFYKELSLGINELVEACDDIVSETSGVVSAIAIGDLSKEISGEYSGVFDDLKKNINLTTQQLREIIQQDIQHVVEAAINGELSSRIPTQARDGFFRDLGDQMNRLLDNIECVFSDIDLVMESLARGDLSAEITTDYQGTYADLKANTNTTVHRLTEIIEKIKHTALEVRAGAVEIEKGTVDLDARTEQQAEELDKTAEATEQMTANVGNTAENTRNAEGQSQVAMAKAEHGGEVIQEVIAAMDEISQCSTQISSIVNVIDEIAFQTNLLALNASVEAARAGDNGRGFSVVASEVRNLAQRSAASAREIKDLIQNSIDKVEIGKGQVSLSESALEEIISSVKTVTLSIKEISTAAGEQSIGIKQVNKAITSVDGMTKQNASLVEETTVVSKNMKEKAEELNNLVSYFK